MQPEPAVRPVSEITEHVVLHCRATRDKAQLASAPQWQIVSDFLVGATGMDLRPMPDPSESPEIDPAMPEADVQVDAEVDRGPAPTFVQESPMNIPLATETGPFVQPPMMALAENDSNEVIDLPAGDTTHAAILSAVVRQGGLGGDWVECPIKAPMCEEAVLAVGRDHKLILMAVAGKGLSELRSIGLALRWMTENRALLRMAFPQLSIDIHAMPTVKLLVDHGDLTADLLQPLLQAATVTVQAYRKLKWGPKTGLLLEAA